MHDASSIGPMEYARLCTFFSFPTQDIINALTNAPFRLNAVAATSTAHGAADERRRIDDAENARARTAEHDLDATMYADGGALPSVTPELVRDAFRFARIWRRAGHDGDALVAFVHGAYLLPANLCSAIADAVVTEIPVLDEPAAA